MNALNICKKEPIVLNLGRGPPALQICVDFSIRRISPTFFEKKWQTHLPGTKLFLKVEVDKDSEEEALKPFSPLLQGGRPIRSLSK